MLKDWKNRGIDIGSGFVAYVGARLIWGTREPWEALHWELLTYGLIFLLLQFVIRGSKYVRRGKV